ncbi:MAG: nucleotidyltransferase family protein [Acidobacteriia bacterium]|nr:nucleotidyltransferase family protein [Terriglobia bacterium]
MTRERGWRQCAGAARPELEFNLCCGRALIDPAANESVRRLIQEGLNWPEVLAVAERHRLSPVVYEVVSAAAQDLISPAQLDDLRQAAAPSMAAGKALLWELIRLHRLFEGAQIPVFPYKGPLLAWIAYGSFLRREYLDLDFAVEQRNIPRTLELLESAGYRPQFDRREAHAGEDGIAPGQYSFQSHPHKILAEFHTERTLRYFPTPIDFQDLNTRLMTVEIGEQRLRTFSIEDTLVMLCVHGAKHFWERLGWVLDIAKLITAQQVNWELLSRIAAKMESTRVLHLGLYLAHDLFGAALPEPMLEEIRRDPAVQELAEKVYEQYSGISDHTAGVLPRAVFRLRSRDKFWPGLRHLLRLGMSPTERDLQTVRLPRYLAPLYVLVRPWRLLTQYGWGWKRRPGNALSQNETGRKGSGGET